MIRTCLLIAAFVACSFPSSAQTGASCETAEVIAPGVHTAPFDDYYYSFTPAATGSYTARTCDLMFCDTKLWAYDHCLNLVVDDGALNSLAYNDDACGLQTIINMNLVVGETYYIRVGDYQNDCADTTVTWELIANHVLPPPVVCDPGQVEMNIVIVPDGYPNEISWDLRNSDGDVLASGTSSGAQLCVPSEDCLLFNIHDSYGDGIFLPGGFWLYIDQELIANDHDYGYGMLVDINCPPGYSCATAEVVGEGSHAAAHADFWYSFTPDTSGTFAVSTCDADCNTRLWIYDHCTNLIWDDTQIGSIYFNDDNTECGYQALLNAMLEDGHTYYIRVGTADGDCTGTIPWSVNYTGPIAGCMDPLACNYNPLATVPGDECIYPGDPDCPNGPDLTVRGDVLAGSIELAAINVGPTDCFIAEGCLDGFGIREIVRFTTHIQNIGNQDFYIGSPGANPDQFNMVNCHGHAHYEGYAEYLLYNDNAEVIVDGFKNGFCVLDLECSMGGTAQYGCGNMGISSMCGDIYGSGLSCQWVDITGVPEGTYTLVVRTNWDNSPDAVGRYETDINNNWAQVCLFIDRTPSLTVTVVNDCDPYVDCLGEIYGSAEYDCMGDCNGNALIGDLNTDSTQDLDDVNEYIIGILGDDIEPYPCTDIDADGNITVSDAALIAFCDYWNTYNHTPDSNAVHDHCNFPFNEIINPFDSVTFTLGAVDLTNGWLDILIKNPNKKLVGYELMMSGIQITSVVNLYDPVNYPITPAFSFGGQHLLGFSAVDSLIERNTSFVPLCRVYFMNAQSTICISEVIDVVNENYMNSTTFLVDPCAVFTGVSRTQLDAGVRIYPNPFMEQTVVLFPTGDGTPARLLVTDLQGREVRNYAGITNGRIVIERGGLARGAYLYHLTGPVQASGRMLVE